MIDVLIRSGVFGETQKAMFAYLKEQHPKPIPPTINWVKAAIDVNNEAMVKALIHDLPQETDIPSLIEYAQARNQRSLVPVLSEELLAKRWIKDLMDNILARLSAYIYRQDNLLDQLAQEDGLPTGSYKKTNLLANASARKSECEQTLKNLFDGPYFNQLKAIYKALPKHSRNLVSISDKMILPRQELIGKIKGSSKDRDGFHQLIQEAINHAAAPFIEGLVSEPESLSSAAVVFINPSPILALSSEDKGSDNEMLHLTEKQQHFVDRFVEQFDQTYQLYKCLSKGDVVRKPDGTDQLAEIAKTVAKGVLPNINISAPMFGIPLPISMSLPSGIAVAAVIDLLMFIRDQTEKNQAQRAGHFFDGWTLRDRVNGIYDCAEFLAMRYRDQIGLLRHDESIPRMADMAVARIFRYAMGAKGHTQLSAPWMMGTVLRKTTSFFLSLGPEPGVVRKSLIEVSVDALSTYEHRVLDDEQVLVLDEPMVQGRPRGWTVKGIFEHTGIRSKGKSYMGINQDVKKYGYAYGSDLEIEKRGMRSTDIIPDFETPLSPVASAKMGACG